MLFRSATDLGLDDSEARGGRRASGRSTEVGLEAKLILKGWNLKAGGVEVELMSGGSQEATSSAGRGEHSQFVFNITNWNWSSQNCG